MPRRPRPAYRLPPKSARQKSDPPKSERPSKTRLAGKNHIRDGAAREFKEGSLSQKKSKNGKQLQAEATLPLNSSRALSRQEPALDKESGTETEFEEGASEGSAASEDSGEEVSDGSDGDAPRVAVWEEDNQDLLVGAFDEEKEMEDEVR